MYRLLEINTSDRLERLFYLEQDDYRNPERFWNSIPNFYSVKELGLTRQ